MLTLGSLFDGLGGWQLAAVRHGVKPLWSSEIEKFCLALTKARFPNTIQLGDVRKIDGGKIEPVSIITMGSPCQDLSVAGTRKGLSGGERSGLFFDAIRIIRQMRDATNGLYPKAIIFENVPGILTSGAGMDWRDVLASYTESDIPIPKSGRWANAGLVRSRLCHVGWIIKDAQFYGVPQRRARLFACVCFGESRFCAEKILFKPDRCLGNNPQKQREGQRVASNTEKSIRTASRIEQRGETAIVKIRSGRDDGTAGKGALLSTDKSFTLGCGNDQTLFQEMEDVYSIASDERSSAFVPNICDTLTHHDHFRSPVINVACFDKSQITCPTHQSKFEFGRPCHTLHQNTCDASIVQEITDMSTTGEQLYDMSHAEDVIRETEISPTLQARMGTGGNQVPIKVESIPEAVIMGHDERSARFHTDTTDPLTASDYKQPPIVAQMSIDVGQKCWVASRGDYLAKFTENQAGALMATDWKDPPVVVTENKSLEVCVPEMDEDSTDKMPTTS